MAKTEHTENYVQFIIDRIQGPVKDALRSILNETVDLADIASAFMKIAADMREVEPPTVEGLDKDNSRIILRVRDEIYERMAPAFQNTYGPIFLLATNYGISKLDEDAYYSEVAYYGLNLALDMGLKLPGLRQPESQLWYKIKPGTRARIENELRRYFNILQEHLKRIDGRLTGEEREKEMEERLKQYHNRIFESFEREVERWRA